MQRDKLTLNRKEAGHALPDGFEIISSDASSKTIKLDDNFSAKIIFKKPRGGGNGKDAAQEQASE